MATVLVVAAHPDDEVLGAGATCAKHVDDGDDVHAVIVSEGATSRYEDGMASALRTAAARSAELIGFASLTFLELPDQRLDTLALIDVTQRLEPIVERLRPSSVYTHVPVDVNTDHGIVARATWTACRPYSAPYVKRLLAFETPSSTEWAWPLPDSVFTPQWFEDVGGTIERKLEAMACYESELRDYPHPRSLQALRERAAGWGSRCGVAFAEPFAVLRVVS
jgi:LmbE family N-acetylglucosaminyl deacetylase